MTLRRATTLRVCFDPGCPSGAYVAPDPDEEDRGCLACGQPEDEHETDADQPEEAPTA